MIPEWHSREAGFVLILSFILVFCFLAFASAAPSVTLSNPANNNVSHTGNASFLCNATDDENVYRIELFADFNGTFSVNSTARIMELETDANTTLLCRFDNSYTCESGEAAFSSSTSFETSKFLQGVAINGSDTLRIGAAGNIEYSRGTIEFWVKPTFNSSQLSADLYLFDINGNQQNEIAIVAERSILTFYFYDAEFSDSSVVANVNLTDGEWYHIAAIWDVENPFPNDEYFDLFINGSNESNSYNSNFGSEGVFGQYIFLGSDNLGAKQFNSTFDELRISNRPRNMSEINESYQRGVGNHSVQSAQFNISGMPDGTYLWNCRVLDNESQVSFASSNFTFSADVGAGPVLNSIALAPNATDDLDPGITINASANVTDVSGVSQVIFQWKETGDWTNDSMDFDSASDLYVNGSITIDPTGGLYLYRITSLDSRGSVNVSSTFNVSAEFDYTWNMSPVSLGTVSGLINVVKNIGNITINNTGDDSLQFSISDDWPAAVFYNGSENPLYVIPAKAAATFGVNATFLNEVGERSIAINATASHATQTPVPKSLLATGTLSAFEGGPYLVVTLTNAPASVAQSTRANMTATVKNIGNETAINITFNWSLPSGWTVTSGNSSLFLDNISVQSTNISTIEVSLSSADAASGLSTVCANATALGLNETSDCENIQVSCSNEDSVCGLSCSFNNDDDCPAGIIGGGGGGGSSSGAAGGGLPVTYSLTVSTKSVIDVYRGQLGAANVSVSSLDRSISGISISVTGYPSGLVSTAPQILEKLTDDAGSFYVYITVPNYTSYGPHNITFVARGKRGANASVIEGRYDAVLFVHSAEEKDILNLSSRAAQYVSKMAAVGLNDDRVKALLETADSLLAGYDYDNAKTVYEEIVSTGKSAFYLHDALDRLDTILQETESYGLESPETRKLYSLSRAAFDRGDYAKAQERITGALTAQGIEIGDRLLVYRLVYVYPYQTLAAIAILAVLIFSLKRYAAYLRRKYRISELKKEENIIEKMLKEFQKRFFLENIVSRHSYEQNVAGFSRRLAKIKRENVKLRSNGSRDRRKILDAMKDLQRKYFLEKTVDRKVYEKTMIELEKELSEAEKTYSRKKGMVSFAFVFLLLVSPFAAHADDRSDAVSAIANSENVIEEMKGYGFATDRLNDTLGEANRLFSRGEYSAAASVAGYISALRDKALELYNLSDSVEERLYYMENRGIDVSLAREYFDSALADLKNERYEDAEASIDKSQYIMNDAEAQYSLQRSLRSASEGGTLLFLDDNKYLIAAAAAILAVAYILTSATRKRLLKTAKLSALRKEKIAIEKTMKDLQRKYFEEGVVFKKQYRISMSRYSKRLGEIEKETAMMSRK